MKEKNFDLDEIEQLAYNGLSNKELAQSLNISDKTYYNYLKKFTHFADSIKRGRNRFKQEIRQALLNKAIKERDTTSLIFLSKRLSLFKNDDEVYNVSLKNTTDILKAIETLFNANIPIEQKNSLKAILDSFIKGYEILELEKRLKKLEDAYNEKYQK